MAASSSGRCFLPLITIILANFCSAKQDALFTIGGLGMEQHSEHPTALVGNSVCSSLPSLPEKRRAGFLGMVNNSMIYCGGRQDLLQINNECWKFQVESKTWEATDSLPRALAGATSIGLNGKLWVFGGVVEEDFYQNNEDGIDYYDYMIEETGNDIFTFDLENEKWDDSKETLPMPLQGSCAIEYMGKILLLGGKNEKEFPLGSNQVWEFDPVTKRWSYKWPKMNQNHFYHGCTLLEYHGQPAIAIGGGQGCNGTLGCSEKVEVLILPNEKDLEKGSQNLDGIVKWEQLPNTQFPHTFMPGLAYINGYLYIVGGGDFGISFSGDKIERYQDGKWWSFGHAPVRAFGSSLTIPSEWLEGCVLEPNLGIHDYYQQKTKDKLKGKRWLCFNQELLLSDQDNTEEGLDGFMNEGCTVPGCNFPHFFRENDAIGGRMSSKISCQVEEIGSSSYQVGCHLSCRRGWIPVNGINHTICNPKTITFSADKLTNFTHDYLECQRPF